MDKWRVIVCIVLLTLSVIDIIATYVYISKYKNWQENKPYRMIENNPLLVYLWNNFGLTLGMIIGAVIIWTLIFLVGKGAYPIVVGLLFIFLCYAMWNHYHNFTLLHALIEKYPSGYLPESIFGVVIGNNPKPK